MPMRFRRAWDFDQGNKVLTFNDLLNDEDVLAILGEASNVKAFKFDGTTWPSRGSTSEDIFGIWYDPTGEGGEPEEALANHDIVIALVT